MQASRCRVVVSCDSYNCPVDGFRARAERPLALSRSHSDSDRQNRAHDRVGPGRTHDPVVVPVSLHGDGGVAPTKLGDSVYSGDVIQTGPDGKAGLVFADGTTFNISSNARMVLNEFIYDPNSKSNSTLLTLTKGAFSFVAGKVAKTGKMEIDTPVATMGIRGTIPRVEFREDGSVAFSTLIEENKVPATQPARGVRERASATPVNLRRAKGRFATGDVEDGGDTRDLKLRICRGC